MKAESKVILTLALVVLMGEILIRPAEPYLSADLRQIREFANFGEALRRARETGQSTVVVVGNSLARAGIDRESLRSGLVERGWPDPLVIYLTPDATGVNEWTAAWRRYVGGVSGAPDLVLIITGPSHLLDQPVRSPEKLAAFFARRSDWPEVLGGWLTGHEERSRFVLAGMSRIFANRDRIRPLLFYRFVPGYEMTANRLNAPPPGATGNRFETSTTAERFTALVSAIEADGALPLVVAVPQPEAYELPEVILRVCGDRQLAVFDAAARERWPADQFSDGYHLGKSGAVRFTGRLAEGILPEGGAHPKP